MSWQYSDFHITALATGYFLGELYVILYFLKVQVDLGHELSKTLIQTTGLNPLPISILAPLPVLSVGGNRSR